jgi:sRNA-binding protein
MDHNDTVTDQIATSQFQNGRVARIAVAKATIELLAEKFPACFAVYEKRRQPLQRGIRGEIWAALNGTITYTALKAALGFYCRNTGYLRNCRAGAGRINLAGEIVDTVTAEEAEHAAAQLAGRAVKHPEPKGTISDLKSNLPVGPKRITLNDLKAAAEARRLQMKTPTTGEYRSQSEAMRALPRAGT